MKGSSPTPSERYKLTPKGEGAALLHDMERLTRLTAGAMLFDRAPGGRARPPTALVVGDEVPSASTLDEVVGEIDRAIPSTPAGPR